MATIIIGNGVYRDPTQDPNYKAPEAEPETPKAPVKKADASKDGAAKE